MSLGEHVGYSFEYDYNSIGAGGSVAVESEDKNSILTYSLDTFFDTVDIIRFDGTDDEGSDDRISIAGTINLYRVLSPKTHGQFGLTVSSQSGFLETPFNSVMIQDPVTSAVTSEVTEELSDSRLRGALYGTVRHSLRPGLPWSSAVATTPTTGRVGAPRARGKLKPPRRHRPPEPSRPGVGPRPCPAKRSTSSVVSAELPSR